MVEFLVEARKQGPKKEFLLKLSLHYPCAGAKGNRGVQKVGRPLLH